MELTGTAGRSLGRRIGAVREGKRAACNDNRLPELARAEGGNEALALARGASAALGAPSNRDIPGRAARRSAVEIYGYKPDHGFE